MPIRKGRQRREGRPSQRESSIKKKSGRGKKKKGKNPEGKRKKKTTSPKRGDLGTLTLLLPPKTKGRGCISYTNKTLGRGWGQGNWGLTGPAPSRAPLN